MFRQRRQRHQLAPHPAINHIIFHPNRPKRHRTVRVYCSVYFKQIFSPPKIDVRTQCCTVDQRGLRCAAANACRVAPNAAARCVAPGYSSPGVARPENIGSGQLPRRRRSLIGRASPRRVESRRAEREVAGSAHSDRRMPREFSDSSVLYNTLVITSNIVSC